MAKIKNGIDESRQEIVKYSHAPRFVPAGQSTQMIIGATPESDRQILKLTAGLYKKYSLKRVFFSAYTPVVEGKNLPALDTKPPLLREHRLYQADWLLRFYGFDADEILDDAHPDFDPRFDPKCCWALYHPEQFPVEVNRAPYEMLLRVPGIGVKCARRICEARRVSALNYDALKKIGVVLKRAQYFILCGGKRREGLRFREQDIARHLLPDQAVSVENPQLSLFDPVPEDIRQCITGQI